MNCTRLSQGDAVWADIGAYATPRPAAAGQSGGGGGSAKELGAYGEYAIALETQLGTYGLYQNTPPLASQVLRLGSRRVPIGRVVVWMERCWVFIVKTGLGQEQQNDELKHGWSMDDRFDADEYRLPRGRLSP